jgi:hypothetical protein
MNYQEAVDNWVNGNISVFKKWLKTCKKMEMLDAIEYYSGNVGSRHVIIYAMREYLGWGRDVK